MFGSKSLPECDYVTFGSSLRYRKSVCLSVTFVRPTQGVETFGYVSSSFCTLAILWPPCKSIRRSSQGNPSVGDVKRKMGNKTERRHVRISHLLMSFLQWRSQGTVATVAPLGLDSDTKLLLYQ